MEDRTMWELWEHVGSGELRYVRSYASRGGAVAYLLRHNRKGAEFYVSKAESAPAGWVSLAA
jgi:hypothetical protein